MSATETLTTLPTESDLIALAAEADAAAEAATEIAQHLAACKAEVLSAIDQVRAIDLKADEAKLTRIYKAGGLMAWFDKFFVAGGKPGQLVDRKADSYAYDLVSNLKRVHARFGTVRPARFTCWSAIVKAVSLDDETLESIDVSKPTLVVAAVAAKSAPVAKSVPTEAVSDMSDEPEMAYGSDDPLGTRCGSTRSVIGNVVAAGPDFRTLETQQSFAAMANELAAHLSTGGDIDPAVWASLKVSLNLILG